MKYLNLVLFFLIIISFSCEEEEYFNCEIDNVSVEVGDCKNDSTYSVTLDFDYANPNNEYFDLFVRDSVLLGYYELSKLPLTIDVAKSGLENDYFKVAINDNYECSTEIEWESPDCGGGDCEIDNVSVEVGDCKNDSTYSVTLDFDYANPNNEYFDLFVRDSVLLGYYELSKLPLTIDVAKSGLENDYFKVAINDNYECSTEIEWESPDCG